MNGPARNGYKEDYCEYELRIFQFKTQGPRLMKEQAYNQFDSYLLHRPVRLPRHLGPNKKCLCLDLQ